MKANVNDDGIRIEVDISVTTDRAWVLLTEDEHRRKWWGDHVELEVRRGGAFRETWSDGTRQVVTSGEVTRMEPPTALEMTWADDDWSGQTRVMFRLSGHGRSTRLHLEHSGWSVHPEEERRQLIDVHAKGWRQHLTRLADYARAQSA